MIRRSILFGALLLTSGVPAVAQQAGAMSVATFLAKAESLRKKGPLALMSGDLKLVTKQIQADGAAIRAERQAAQAAGRQPNHRPPAGGVKMTDKDILAAMQAVPAEERARTSTKDAMRVYLARRFPCGRA